MKEQDSSRRAARLGVGHTHQESPSDGAPRPGVRCSVSAKGGPGGRNKFPLSLFNRCDQSLTPSPSCGQGGLGRARFIIHTDQEEVTTDLTQLPAAPGSCPRVRGSLSRETFLRGK